MIRLTVSLPEKLKKDIQTLIEAGFYASFSDAVRSTLRDTVRENKYNLLAEKAEKEYQEGKSVVLEDKKDIDNYLKDK